MSRYVISLGGNALGNNAEEQKKLLVHVAEPIVSLIEAGHEVVIVHGNGPQVGMINLAFTESKSAPDMPFPECGAMSQGYIGFHLQNAIQNALAKKHIEKQVGTLVTQVVVDEHDPLFLSPSKPVGAFYSKEESEKITLEKGYVMKEDSGRGYRRVVASPLPIDVVEKKMILSLLKDNHVVICAGGGGIPVIRHEGQLTGIAAVIDKDYASAKVAELIDADILVILTAVDNVYVNFNKPNQKKLELVTMDEIEAFSKEGQFAKGSMFPKVQACLMFLKGKKNKTAIISSLDKAVDAFAKKSGTIIHS
ncbi:MAG: carbamate kinase [Firmicutes bacterium]|nr:carbamate kinase [Bacillota bacterium]